MTRAPYLSRFRTRGRSVALLSLLLLIASSTVSPAEVMLQYFNTPWRELVQKMPELAEVGYSALWLPPPTKGSSVWSVGYDLWDPFDIGGKDQRGTVRTRYGTEQELLELIRVAHRFGIRVYFDNIMNHRAFDVPGYNEYTSIHTYPGMLPEDFHLRVTEEGFYRKWDNVADWGDTWQVQNRNFSDLIDIAQETIVYESDPGRVYNGNFGKNEGDHSPKISFVRHPDRPDYYYREPTAGNYVGFGTNNGITTAMLVDPENAWLYEEDVNAYLIRAVRWLVHHTRVDGLRLDAVKHVPAYFFGEQWAGDKDFSDAGYCGQAQLQFNKTRNFLDSNHRDSLFDPDRKWGRDDLMMFGEHLGAPPSFDDYIAAGMRLVDSQLHGFLNGNLGSPWGYVGNLGNPWAEGFGPYAGVPYVKSHDDGYANRPELHFAYLLTRQGVPNVYTDGNYQSETLGESGGAFPRHANTAFLGQFGDARIPNLVYIHDHFARGTDLEYDSVWRSTQVSRWGDADVVAYERHDWRENPARYEDGAVVLFFVMNDNYSSGEYREIWTQFAPGDYLWQYAAGGGGFYYTVPADRKIKVIVPPGGYFAFSYRTPEESDLWAAPGGSPVTLYENGTETGWISYVRKDGPDGDPGFNPYGVGDPDPTDFAYEWFVPRVTSGTNLRFVARVDGSAANVLMKLDGGVNLNSTNHFSGDPRDHPPANEGGYSVFEGYEQINFVRRQNREKFAAVDTLTRNVIGSNGAETYIAHIGPAGSFDRNDGVEGRDSDQDTAAWIYHEPGKTNDASQVQFWPNPTNAANAQIYVWVKVGYAGDINKLYLYYTTEGGDAWPEGAGGEGLGSTEVVELTFDHSDAQNGSEDWWSGTVPPQPAGTELRYKIGGFWQQGAGSWEIVWPGNAAAVARKKSMLGVWQVDNYDATAVEFYPHMDFDDTTKQTGLDEGMHVLRARAFLNRQNGDASLYNTFVQPFYYDVTTPGGEFAYPENDGDTIGGSSYGVVVRTDSTVTDLRYRIVDDDPTNDDLATGVVNGNGFMTNSVGETNEAWAVATEDSPSLDLDSEYPAYPREWRFSYVNIPADTNATIHVRLLEISSSTNMALSAVEGHYGEISRAVWVDGLDRRLFFDWPDRDGVAVKEGWTIRALYSEELRWDDDGFGPFVDDTDFRDSFLIEIDGEAQGKDQYAVDYDLAGPYGQIEFVLPDKFTGDPDHIHHLRITHEKRSGVILEADRYVRWQEGDKDFYVSVHYPPEYDSDGKPFEIYFPKSSAPSSRQVTIEVETGLGAQATWIQFRNSAGTALPFATTSNALWGTVSLANATNLVSAEEIELTGLVTTSFSNALVTGTNTLFLDELTTSSTMRIESNRVVVTQIVSQTELRIGTPWPGSAVSNVAAAVVPDFYAQLTGSDTLMVDGQRVGVQSILSTSNLVLTAPWSGATANGLTAYRIEGNGWVVGNLMHWQFLWSNIGAGSYTFDALVDTDGNTGTVEAFDRRNVRITLRESVEPDPNDDDDDDDGLMDSDEGATKDLPNSNPETWSNGQVHVWRVFGRTDPLLPDSDSDGLPDGLESGWRGAVDPPTDLAADTDGDGYPNFLADHDPPFFNTVPDNWNLPDYVFYGSRTDQIHGSMTDPNNPDSDWDGIPDGVEDANRNGWADGDGEPLPPDWDPWPGRDWPDGKWTPAWKSYVGRETDPNKNDTDEDGLNDGWGEDYNANGWIDGDSDSNRTWSLGEAWQETDPLNADSDGDGLPDGWERRYAFDPLDAGVLGVTNRRGNLTTSLEHGANGNPDGDVYIDGFGETNDYVNLLEFQNGTNPRWPDTQDPPVPGDITIGPGPAIGVINGVTNYQEFMDWSWHDLLILDQYEGAGPNNQLGDVYKGWDGWDTSRDIVAFYVHDGGAAPPAGEGDGIVYFRVDFHDLRDLAEEGNLDVYVVIDIGNPASGEKALPDDIDARTEMGWELVVACYQSGNGRVYVDTDGGSNSQNVNEELTQYGVMVYGQGHEHGFVDAYYNAALDAVEFGISRTAFTDGTYGAGWGGSGFSNFNYQVYTTKDGTGNSPVGAGDIGGRNDIRDSILDDRIAEDYWQSQQGLENILYKWFSGRSRAGRAKVASIVHGNQAIRPGSYIQDLINNGEGAGYHRAPLAHEVFMQPLNLHITPTLASAIEWAAVDPAAGKPWLDGPALNARIRALIATNRVYLLGSTFSDHMLPYFTHVYNRDNETLARMVLQRIYDCSIDPAQTVFWPPERLLDIDAFEKIRDMGFLYTVLDQDTHLFNWYGREDALTDGAYKINEIRNAANTDYIVRAFVINNVASSYRFDTDDGGLDLALRGLLNRKAYAWMDEYDNNPDRIVTANQDQVVTIMSNWEDFRVNENADAYDINLRWLANRPWTPVVALEQIVDGQIDVTADGVGDPAGVGANGWVPVHRTNHVAMADKEAHNWLNHATQADYDNWYVGQPGVEEGLQSKVFDIRPGTPVPAPYGMLYSTGIVSQAWTAVQGVADTNLSTLARAALHASVFQAAFHNEEEHNLSRYSTGEYMYPAQGSNSLAEFAVVAQSQTRFAAVYGHVDNWAASAAGIVTPQAQQLDVDLDGEDEYVLYNDRLYVLFEAIGGRMTGAWVRDPLNGRIYQALGNVAGYAGSTTEEEGAWNVETDGSVAAHRTSGLKDWWGQLGGGGAGTLAYVNKMYGAEAIANGWRFTSISPAAIRKEITLAPHACELHVSYDLSDELEGKALYVRTGLSPNLADLLVEGQATLGAVSESGGVVRLANTNYSETVLAYIGLNGTVWQSSAEDEDTAIKDFATVPMRNQAQTHQVELSGTGSFSFSLGFRADPSDWDGDGLPNEYEDDRAFLDPFDPADGTNDYDEDGVINSHEWISNTDPDNDGDYLRLTEADGVVTGFAVRFPAKPNRVYTILYDNDLIANPGWSNATPMRITVPVATNYTWVDDGSTTIPHPTNTPHRFYDVGVRLP